MSLIGHHLNSSSADFPARLQRLTDWSATSNEGVVQQVREILDAVRREGDQAVLGYTALYDDFEVANPGDLEVSRDEMAVALRTLPAVTREALGLAAERITSFHRHQLGQLGWEIEDSAGHRIGQKVTPLGRVGVYVPGGKASYPSTVLMTVIPARVAGVEEIVLTVPAPSGEIGQALLAAASLAGVDRLFRVGGAQAVGAMAYGTRTIPRVDKIVGPGNLYVSIAKQQVFGQVGIDMLAGPSEVLILADAGADADWLALDMFAQAEHDESAQAILVSWDASLLIRVEAAMERLIGTLSRRSVIETSLRERGAMIRARDLQDAMSIVNRVAPEHLELAMQDTDAALDLVRHAGAVFVGNHSAEVFGDYVAGPSHVLPTGGTARYSSGLDVSDFQKRTSIFRASREGIRGLAMAAAEIARNEGLTAHAAAARARLFNEAGSGNRT